MTGHVHPNVGVEVGAQRQMHTESEDAVTTLSLDVYTSPQRKLPGDGSFSPTTSTLVLGTSETLLVDTGYTLDDVQEIARRITRSGRTLTTIYITHAHADHYLGLQWLLEHFPTARAVADPAVAEQITRDREVTRQRWSAMFGGLALENSVTPDALESNAISVDGEDMYVLPVGQGDIPHNTVVHIPAIEAVIAGDIAYNGIHPFLAASGPDEWVQWIDSIDSIDAITALTPRILVPGHKRPELPDDDPSATLAGTKTYIQQFIAAVDEHESARDVAAHMLARFPEHGNPSALFGSAAAAFTRRTNTHA